MKKKLQFLFLTCAAVAAMFAGTANVSAQEQPTDGGVYYLYNTESGNYLSRGSNYGTKTITQPVGMPWKVTIADGSYKLQMYDLTVAGSTTGYGSNGFADNGTPIAFTPDGDAASGYTLANGSNYLAQDGQLSETSGTWQFLTQAQYTAKLAAKATAQESAIATAAGITLGESTLESIVGNSDNYTASFTNDGIPTSSTWTVTGVPSRGGTQNWGPNYGGEIYQGGGRYTKTISGLKKGIYKVTVRAMKRVGSNANCYTMGEAGYPVSDAYLDANGYFIPIQSWYEGCTSNSAPNATTGFMTQVNAGKYKASGFVYVGEEGTMSLKAISEAYWNYSWFLFDGVEYTYYSNEVTSEEAEALLASVPTGAMDADVRSTLNDAQSAFDTNRTIAKYNALSQAITTAKESITAYAAAKATADKAKAMAAAANVDVTTASTAFTTAYEEGTLNGTTEADAVVSAYTDGLATKLDGCTDFTSKITNPSFEEGSTNGWTNTNCGNAANNGNFGLATGSYFVEKWIAASGTLADGTLTQTIANLPKGEYILTAEMKNEQQSGNTAEKGFFLTIGDKQFEVNTATGETYALSFTTTAKSDITIGAKLEGCTGNWMCVDNFKLYFNGIDTQLLADEIQKATDQYNTYDPNKDYAVTLKDSIDVAQNKLNAGFTKAADLTTAVTALQQAEATAKAAYLADNYADLADGKYIISTDGLYLGAGNSWGTQASLLAHPEYVTLAKMPSGKYTIESQVSNGGNDKYFNGSYMDGAATEIAIIKIGDNYYMTADGSNFYYNNSGIVGTKTEMTAWSIISLTYMDTKMAEATAENPMDITYKVLDPNFGRNNVNCSAWTQENVTQGGDRTNMLYEAYKKTFSMKQTISNLPAGTYEIKATCMYRQDGSDETLPYMFANGVNTNFAVNTGGENNMSAAAAAMANGSYEISAKVYIQNGQIRLGTATNGTSCWSIWDNFALYYLGSTQAEGVENSEYAGIKIVTVGEEEATSYGTFCAPFAVTIPENVQAYTVDGADDNGGLTLTEVVTTIPANTPVVLAATTTTDIVVDNFGSYTTGTCTSGLLTGVYEATPAPVGTYVLLKKDQGLGFYKVVAGNEPTVGANRCYLTKSSETKAFFFDNATAIKTIESLTSGSAKIYDLNGRELKSLQKGINIVGGKKILVK